MIMKIDYDDNVALETFLQSSKATSGMPTVLIILGKLWGDNGITAHLMTLSQCLISSGCKVGLATSIASNDLDVKEEASRAIERLQKIGVEYFPVPFPLGGSPIQKSKKVFSSLYSLQQVIQRFKPDVLHVHSLATCPIVYPLRVFHHIPMVSSCHLEPDPNDLRLGIKMAAFFNKYLFRNFLGDRLIAVSLNLQDAFINLMNVPESNIRIIHYGMNTDHFKVPNPEERQTARQFYGLSDSSVVACLLGRLAPVKGHDVLIQAIQILKSREIEVTVLCAGKGYRQEEEDLQAAIEKAGVSHLVKLLGFTDTRQVLWASDIKVLPSRREAAPLVIQEAMLCGVVPIRTPASGVKDQIQDGVDGFVVPFDDAIALADRLQMLVENPTLRHQMSTQAYESAQQKFTSQKMTEKMLAVYAEVIPRRVQ
jgi:glycosyltransferase involved in cell wall biosynthesis